MQLITEFKVEPHVQGSYGKEAQSCRRKNPQRKLELRVYVVSGLRKPEICEGTLDVCWLAEQRIYLNVVHDQEEFLQCL